MADFCNQCAKELNFPSGDLAGITKQVDWVLKQAALVICEGCGPIQVDPDGNCVSSDCFKNGHEDAIRD